jgi:putative peptidoglycan lipid II flippase
MSSPTPGPGPGQIRPDWAGAVPGWEPLERRPEWHSPEPQPGWPGEPAPQWGQAQPEPAPQHWQPPPSVPTAPMPTGPMDGGPPTMPEGWAANPWAAGAWADPPPAPAADPAAGGGAGHAAAPPQSAERPEASDGGLMKASRVIAVGTLASRVTGFLRTMMMAYALGATTLADAYNNANTLPNIVFDLVLGGIITSVFVPLLVNAGRRHRDGGLAYDQRTFSLVVTVLFVSTTVATLAAGPLVDIYAHALSGPERSLTVIFARFFIPQVFFYGVASVAGAILNARGHFSAPGWTPLVNNVVVIAVMALFLAVAGPGKTPSTVTASQVGLLGLGTTLGLAAQVAAMIPAFRSIGFKWRFRLDFAAGELTEIGRMSSWLVIYTLTTAVSYLITMNLANYAEQRAQAAHVGYGAGFTVWNNGWILFQLPYAIIGMSVMTALLPRMSGHAGEGRFELVRRDFSRGVRLASVIIAPVALGMAVLASPLSALILGHGSTSVASATYMGEVLAVFSVGLLPYMLFQLLLRIFYAMHDSRTAAMVGVAVMAVNVAAAYAALELLPPGQVTAGLAAAFGLGNVAGTAIAWRILIRRTGGLDGRRIFSSVGRMHVAAIPGLIFAVAAALGVGVLVRPGTVNGLFTVAIGGLGGLALYVLFARALSIPEVTALWDTVSQRLRR